MAGRLLPARPRAAQRARARREARPDALAAAAVAPVDADELDAFLGLLPRSTAAAAALAAEHDERLDGRAFFEVAMDRPLRNALEVRSPTFVDTAFPEILRRHGVALVAADAPARWPFFTEVTADFVYVRMHGAEELYASGYTDAALDEWATRLRGWAEVGLDVFVYFDIDAKVRAPFDALSLRALLGQVE